MDLHDAFASLVEDVPGIALSDLDELRRQSRWRQVARATTVVALVGVVGVVAAVFHDDRGGPPTITRPDVLAPATPSCELPRTVAVLNQLVAPNDVVARVTIGRQAVVDEVYAGTLPHGVIALAPGQAPAPGTYVLVLRPAGRYYALARELGITTGGNLVLACTTGADPLYANGSLRISQLQQLLAERVGKTLVSGSLSRFGGPYPGSPVRIDGTVHLTSSAETMDADAVNGTWSVALKPGTYTVTGTGAGVTCGSQQVVVGTAPKTGVAVGCPVP